MSSARVSCAIVCEFTNPVQNQVDNLFANGVVTSRKVVGTGNMCCWQFLQTTVKCNENCLNLAFLAAKRRKDVQGIKCTFYKWKKNESQVTSCKVVGRVLFSRNQLFRMEELAVCARAHLVNHRRFLWASDFGLHWGLVHKYGAVSQSEVH